MTLSAACSTQGLSELANKLQQFCTSLNINKGCSSGISDGTSLPQQQQQQQQELGASLSSPQQRHQQQSQGQPGSSTRSSSSSSAGVVKRGDGAAAGGLMNSSSSLQGVQLPGPARPSHNTLLHLMQGLCLQLSRALLPTYADWLLRFWMGVLLLPGAAALHTHVLLLLRCLFDTPGLQLGSGVALLLDGAFLSPIVNLSQVRR